MAVFTDLAIETRLQMFELLLGFPRPRKRVPQTPATAANARANRNSRPKRLFGKIHATAILFVSCKIHAEAIVVF